MMVTAIILHRDKSLIIVSQSYIVNRFDWYNLIMINFQVLSGQIYKSGIRTNCSLVFYEMVENPFDYDNEVTDGITDDQSLCKLVLNGKYESGNKNCKQVKMGVYENSSLTLRCPPPAHDLKLTRSDRK